MKKRGQKIEERNLLSQLCKFFAFSSLIIFLSSCVSYIPEEEMFLAKVALEAAKEAKADVFSPSHFQRAEEYVKASERARRDRSFDLAKKYALQAQSFAEKAEDEATLKQAKNE